MSRLACAKCQGDRMKLTENEIRQLYLDVSAAYNTTALAVNDGWIHHTSDFGLLEMKTLVKHLPKDGVLVDIGTGMGIAPRLAHKLGARVITVDSLAAAGASAIDNVRLAGIEGHFCDVGRERIPVENGVADCVFFADVIEHLICSPKPVLEEISRVLKPGGTCVSTTPNACRLTVRLKVLMGYSNWPPIHEFFDLDFHSGHHHEYTIGEFQTVFNDTGLDVTEFVLYENNLRTVKIWDMHDITTQNRSRIHRETEPVLATIGRSVLLALTTLRPQLRSDMLLVARKPG